MNCEFEDLKQDNSIESGNFLSRFFFCPIIKLYKKKLLTNNDLFTLPKAYKAKYQHDKLTAKWSSKQQKSLIKILLQVHWKVFLTSCILSTIQFAVIRPFQCVTIRAFIEQFSYRNSDSLRMQIIFGSLCLVATLFIVACSKSYLQNGLFLGVKLRTSLTCFLYEKILTLGSYSLSSRATGEILSYFSTDLNKMERFAVNVGHVFSAPCQIIVTSYLLWIEFGLALCVVLVFFLIMTSTYFILGTISSKLRKEISEKSGARVKLMHEILTGIKVIKMYTWEEPFKKLINLARLSELKPISKALRAISLQNHYIFALSQLNAYLAIVCYTLIYKTLTISQLFYLMTLLYHWRLNFMFQFPVAITSFLEIQSSLSRIQEFLEEPELQANDQNSQNEIYLEQIEATLPKSIFTLKTNRILIEKGKFCTLIGEVGSGKTTFLHLLLNEITIKTGKSEIIKSISYASQDPWIFPGSIKDNILFGQEFQEKKYKKVIHCCSLEADFQALPEGDLTLTGERGVFLSGGQKARVNLARTLYKEAELYLLDDPLSAVDTKVAKHLFHSIKEFLKEKTVVLVTHQFQFLEHSDVILTVNQGNLELVQNLQNLNQEFLSSSESSSNLDIIKSQKLLVKEPSARPQSNPLNIYLKSGGSTCLISLIFFLWFLTQLSITLFNFWVTLWIQYEKTTDETNLTNLEYWLHGIFQETSQENGLKILSAITLATILIPILTTEIWFKLVKKSSKKLHENMFESIMQAPISFFDSNHTGTILNRFSGDLNNIDESLPTFLAEAVMFSLTLLLSIITVIITNYYVIIFILLSVFPFWKILSAFRRTSNQVKHLTLQAQSPILSYVTNTLSGIITIRAHNNQSLLFKEFLQLQNIQSAAQLTLLYCAISFTFWIDLFYCIFLAVVISAYILVNNFLSPLDDSQVGLGISIILLLLGLIQYTLHKFSDCLNQLTSVERIKEYIDLTPEESFKEENYKKTFQWPSQGKIEYKNVTLKYGQDKTVLKNLNFTINSKEKIGIVGRTGVGKSSLTSLLFRLTNFEGSILIDGLNIKEIKLQELRKHLWIIPQDPMLFSESVRFNLDPLNEFEDSQIWKALEEVELRNAIPKLTYEISEGGKNLSLGQRQLLCLSRAILRQSKIVVIDEATANIDQKNDEIIQKTIRKVFKNCTVITIAHRLQSILDSDKILVLESKGLAEFDHAHVLLSNPQSTFYKMAQETGQATLLDLKEKAFNSYSKENQ